MGYLFVSGWMREPGPGGITQYRFYPDTGEIQKIRTILEDTCFNVSCLDETNDILYALSEVPDLSSLRFGGGGCVYAFHLDRETGDVKKTDVQPLYCANPCNLALDAGGNYMMVTGHGTRNYVTKLEKDAFGRYSPVVLMDDTPVMLLSINPDGSVGSILDVDKHTGSGPTGKQLTARPHSATRSPSGKLFAVCDKGNDHIYMYRIDREKNKLVLCSEPAAVPPGTEPRYCVFHPTLPLLYLNTENSTQLYAYRYTEDGQLSFLSTYEALEVQPSGKGKVEQQGLCMHPSGQYLYDVVHGPNQIAVFRIDQTDGSLTLIQNQAVDHDWPRGAAISPNGKFLAVACVRGQKAVTFQIGDNGMLTPTGFACDQPNAAYATFWDA